MSVRGVGMRIETNHAENRWTGFESVNLQDGQLELKALQPGSCVVVLRSEDPLTIESVVNGSAELRPGWDGSLGYSLYAAHITAAAPTDVLVRLKTTLQPDKPVATTLEQLAAFQCDLAARGSLFPEQTESFRRWQADLREKLTVRLMNGGLLPPRIPLAAKATDTMDFPVFTLRRVTYRSQPDRETELLLALPKGVPKAPLLVAIHGHEAAWGQADAGAFTAGHADDFCGYFAERGWAVLQPATMNHTLQHAGWTLQGEWTWDVLKALDYAVTVAEIDSARIAVCGLSTGAHLAMNVLALDDRVRAGVVAGILAPWHHLKTRFRIPPHCDCGITGQLSDLFEECDWAALAAPKRVQYQHGRQDACMCPAADPALLNLKWNTGVMPTAEFDALFAEVQRAWRVSGNPTGVEAHFHGGKHAVNNAEAFAWLSQKEAQRWGL